MVGITSKVTDMKYAIYILLAFALFAGCKTSLVENRPFEIAIPDGVQIKADSVFEYPNGYRAKLIEGKLIAFPPPVIRKQKLKNVGNDYSKVKDAGNYTDKSKDKPKVKADIIGNNNSQEEAEEYAWLKWVCIAVIVVIGVYYFGPLIKVGVGKVKEKINK